MVAERITIQEQENVKNVLNKSAIVSASAGSGKTTVLIEKITKCIVEQRVDVSNILALTYTNSAAAEMRTKLVNSLSNCINEDAEFVEFISDQIDKLSTADISTFHSFYERLVKKYFYLLNITPSFSIIEQEKLYLLKNKAFQMAIDKLKEEDFEKYFTISDVLGRKRKDKLIQERILKIDEFLSSQLDSEKWLNKNALFLFEDKNRVYSLLVDEIKENIDRCIIALEGLLSKSVDIDETVLSQHINDCLSILNKNSFNSFEDAYNFMTEFKFPNSPTSKKISNDELLKDVKEVKEELKNFIDEYKNLGGMKEIESSFLTCKDNIISIIGLYKNYKAFLIGLESEECEYDFSQLEQFCYQILKNEDVQKEIRSQYKLVFVDEFQDINPIQYQILKLIINDDNVLFVGDPKQSIYAFRQSDVDIFVNIFNQFERSENAEALPLNCNFRSNKKILDFDNKIFNTLMTEKSCGINYEKDAQFNGQSKNDCQGPAVIVSVLQPDEEKETKKVNSVYKIFEDVPEKKEPALEAKLITHQIGKIIREDIFEGNNQTSRKINFNDIAILVRNRSDLLKDLIKCFKKYNIPFVVNDNANLFDSKEINLIISLLNLCLNNKNDMHLAPILVSAFGKLSFDDVAKIRRKFLDEEFFHTACERYANEINDDISKKIKTLYDSILDLKNRFSISGVSQELDLYLYRNGFYAKILAKSNGKEKLSKVHQFLHYISKGEFNFDLFGLVNSLNQENEIKIDTATSSDVNAVTITTIHGSKGLEYPVVFFADAGKDLSKKGNDRVSDFKINKEFGFVIKNYSNETRKIYNSVFEKIVEINENKKDVAENLRLLYVALTRAKNKLYISGKVDKIPLKIGKNTNLVNVRPYAYMSYILGALNEKERNDLFVKQIYKREDLLLQLISKEDFVYEKLIQEQSPQKQLNNIKEARKHIAFKYNKEAVYLAQKTSVTEIAFEDNGVDNQTSAPQTFHTSEHLTVENKSSTEKGILIHYILENIDFYAENLQKEIDKLKISAEELFNKEELYILIDKNVQAIKNILPKENKNYKEKQFMLSSSLNDIYGIGGGSNMLIQGKIDLLSLGKRNILVDYKLTTIRDKNKLQEKYKRQLLAYAFAIENAIGIHLDNIYILSLFTGEIIAIER